MIRRTSMNLDMALVDEARVALGTTGTTETIHAALREAVRQTRLRYLLDRDFEIRPEELAEMRTWGAHKFPDLPELE
jgi:Arc/MetJ family transcription regulator